MRVTESTKEALAMGEQMFITGINAISISLDLADSTRTTYNVPD